VLCVRAMPSVLSSTVSVKCLRVISTPTVVLEWLALLLCVQELAAWNYGPETGYPYWEFCDFSEFFQYISGYYFKLGHDRFLPHPLQFIIHLSPFNSTLYNLSYWERVVKLTTNK
jgi:hypothetical protein